MKCRAFFLMFCVLALVVAGCGKSDSTGGTSGKGTQSAGSKSDPGASAQNAEASQAFSAHVTRQPSLEGRWLLLFYQRYTAAEVPAALIDIGKSEHDSRLAIKRCRFTPLLTNPTLKERDVTPNAVHLVIEMAVQSLGPGQQPTRQTRQADVLVEFRDGYARGDAQFNPTEDFMVAMVPTKLDRVDDLHPETLPEAPDLGAATKDTKPEEFFKKSSDFVAAHPDSPMTIEIYPFIFKTAGERKMNAATLRENAEKFYKAAAHWGDRAGFKARIEVIGNLVATNYMPSVAIQQIDAALAKLNEDTIAIWKSELEALRETAVTNRALARINRGSAADQAKSAEVLRHHKKQQPYDPVVMYELARYDERQGHKEAAMKGFAEVAVLPMFDHLLHQMWSNEKVPHTQPRDAAAKLWKEQHNGKTDGFDQYLDSVYAESMPQFKGRPVQPRPHDPANRVVLCELFTGTDCPPCVAADAAFSQLLKTYGDTEVIALQYHEHSPQPDPLANEDTEGRLRYYFPERGSTPTFVISGSGMNAGGFLHQTPMVYRTIRQSIEHFLTRKTSVRIHLAAQPKGNAVGVTADVDGSFPLQDPIRLRLALAEEHVRVRGSNGIRVHEMVVRAMPGGIAGIEIKDGKLHYEGTIDLKSIRQQLDDYLTAYEQSQKMTFPKKPLDLAHLHLVAFVQNDRTFEVYQAATTPLPQGGSSTAQSAPTDSAAARSAVEPQKAVLQEAHASDAAGHKALP